MLRNFLFIFIFYTQNVLAQNQTLPQHFALMMHSLEEYQDKNVYPAFLVLQQQTTQKMLPKEQKKVLELRTQFQKLQKNKKRIFQEKTASISPDSVMIFWEFCQKEETRIWQEMEKCTQKYAIDFDKNLQEYNSEMKKWRKEMDKIIKKHEINENPEKGVFLGKFNFGKFFNVVDVMLWQYEKLPQEAQAEIKWRD